MKTAAKFENLSRSAMQRSAQVILEASDFVFLLWPDGDIAEATCSDRTHLDFQKAGLQGQDVSRIVEAEDAPALQALIAQARDGKPTKPVKLRHSALIKSGTTARYSAHLAGDGKNVVLLGSAYSVELTLAAKITDAEFARRRPDDEGVTEARYRMLFEASSEGVLIVDSGTGRIDQANANAAALIGLPTESLEGTPYWSHFADEEAGLQFSDAAAQSLDVVVRVMPSAIDVHVTTQAIRGLDRAVLIVRLNRVASEGDAHPDDLESHAIELIRRTSIPVLLADQDGAVCWSNGALAALTGSGAILGRQVSELFGISPYAMDIALREADQHGQVLTSIGALDGYLAVSEDAYVSIVSIPEGSPASYGFLIRLVHDEDPEEEHSALAELVGNLPMKNLVRKSTDVIERNCIQAALRLTGNNRAAAANVLGLSRQSLYLKMRQHGLR